MKPMKTLKITYNIIRYGLFLSYHLRQRKKYDIRYPTVITYHHEMCLYYYEKIFMEPLDGERDRREESSQRQS